MRIRVDIYKNVTAICRTVTVTYKTVKARYKTVKAERGTYKTAKARFWPWLRDKFLKTLKLFFSENKISSQRTKWGDTPWCTLTAI